MNPSLPVLLQASPISDNLNAHEIRNMKVYRFQRLLCLLIIEGLILDNLDLLSSVSKPAIGGTTLVDCTSQTVFQLYYPPSESDSDILTLNFLPSLQSDNWVDDDDFNVWTFWAVYYFLVCLFFSHPWTWDSWYDEKRWGVNCLMV